MTSSEWVAASPPSISSPSGPPSLLSLQHQQPPVQPLPPLPQPPASCYTATRSSFQQIQMQADDTVGGIAPASDYFQSADKNLRGSLWKDEWVVSLIHLRGSIEEEETEKSGIDMWSKVSSQLAELHPDFDKNSESCRKKWQRIYKTFRDDKALLAMPGDGQKQLTCKWYDLIDHYMHDPVDVHKNDAEPIPVEEMSQPDRAPVQTPTGSVVEQCRKAGVKRTRRDQKIEQSLSQMVEAWKESLQVLKDSEAKRVEILQTLSGTMVALLDILRQ